MDYWAKPPIHPKIIAGVILYGMSPGQRSSRVLERSCTTSLDFIWLASGHRLDHSTICQFRTKFTAELKDLFKQIGRMAMALGLITLNRVGLDGTRVLANSSRHGTRTAKTLAEKFLADSAHGDGQNLAALEARGVEAYIPMDDGGGKNPARRADVRTPVAADQRDCLPYVGKKQTKKLAKSAFVYDAASDSYYCPMGRALSYWRSGSESRRDSRVKFRVYRCVDCEECPLSSKCRKSDSRRTVRRDQHESLRESMSKRMRSESGQKEYAKRKWICETPFGLLKGVWCIRQFLHRGLAKVRSEWSWTCTAYNLAKLVREVARLRAQFAAMAV